MSVTVATMVDVTSGSDTAKLGLNTFKFVGGYVSGKAGTGIQWTPEQWQAIKPAMGVRIWQGYGAAPEPWGYDEIDVERGALTPAGAAACVRQRVDAGITWTYLYGSLDQLVATGKAIRALGEKYWVGHVQCRLADWSLDRVEAEARVGTYVAGMTCYAVQWASPESNPNTIMPGPSGLTLKQANTDLSVIDVRWEPTPPKGVVAGTPTLRKIQAVYSDGSVKDLLNL